MPAFFEYRFYDVTPGRLGEEVDRMRRVAVDDAGGGQSLFGRYGVPRPLAVWTSVAGSRHPAMHYLLHWPSFEARDRAFPAFWQSPEWTAIYRDTNDGHPMVDAIDNWILGFNPRWTGVAASGALGPFHELRVHRIFGGYAAPVADYLADVEHPLMRVFGGHILGMFDVLIGPAMPAIVSFIAWPGQGAQEAAARRLDADPRVLDRFRAWRREFGHPLIRAVDSQLLKPTEFGSPLPLLGLGV